MKQETAQDRANELEVINKVAQKWDVEVFKNPEKAYNVDFSLLKNGKVWALAEVKCRNEQFEPYKISMRKTHELCSYASEFPTINVFLIVQWKGHGIHYVDVQKIPKVDFSLWDTHVGEKRGAPCDKEPAIEIDLSRFKKICD